MELKDMSIDELMERRAAIAEEVEAPEADLDALEEEARAIKAELEARKAAETKRAEIRSAVAGGEGKVEKKIEAEERKTMTNAEVRKSDEYINAFAEYIKTGDDRECRALLTENVNGTVPVPEYIEGRIRAAWEKNGLLDLVRKTYVKGNLKVGFEISATGAVVHTEGTDAPAEETLTLGVVNLVPVSIKKWIRISDEAYDLGGQEFLDYIYDELTYQIAKAAEDLLVSNIANAPATSSASAVGVPHVNATDVSLDLIAQAVAKLSDNASDITVVMNRLSHPAFVQAMIAANFMFDPLANVRVVYNNTLPSVDDISSGGEYADKTWIIVGDFSGAQANFPNGDEIKIKFDDLSEAEADLVKIVGRELVGIGVTKPGMFVNIVNTEPGE